MATFNKKTFIGTLFLVPYVFSKAITSSEYSKSSLEMTKREDRSNPYWYDSGAPYWVDTHGINNQNNDIGKSCSFNGNNGVCVDINNTNCNIIAIHSDCSGNNIKCCLDSNGNIETPVTTTPVTTTKKSTTTKTSEKTTTKTEEKTKTKTTEKTPEKTSTTKLDGECPTLKNADQTKSGKTKIEEITPLILNTEGGCQNLSNDSGNIIDNKIGYTCMGVTPKVGWNNREKYFKYAVDECTDKVMFTYCAYNLNKSKFKTGTENLVDGEYAKACSYLPQPAYYVCTDMRYNGTPSVRKMKEDEDTVDYCLYLVQRGREHYTDIIKKNSDNEKFKKGWENRSKERESYCKSYC